jgi:hypothetical protein
MTKHDTHGRQNRAGMVPSAQMAHDARPASPIYRILPFLLVAILAAVPFCMGKYFEFNSPEPFDGGAYLYSANHILNGARIGIDEIPSAHPGTLFVNMLSVVFFGYHDVSPKIMQGFFQAAALVVMFLTLRKLWGTLAAGVSTVMASVYLSAPFIAKYGNVKEQFMIAFMVLGVCCLIWQQLSSRWWCGLLAGAFLIWAPMFKPTGVSALAGAGVFVLLQPLLRNRTWRQMGVDLGLLFGGAFISMAPMYMWVFGWHVQMAVPYGFVADAIIKHLPGHHPSAAAEAVSDYVAASHEAVPWSDLAARVTRYYMALRLPIAIAIAAVALRVARWGMARSKSASVSTKGYERFVLVLAVWWILDMAFIWVSAHSYEQYYLPLTASAAMLGGYVVALYADRLKVADVKAKWAVLGLAGAILMLILAGPVLFGQRRSPYGGNIWPQARYGYTQKWEEIGQRRAEGLKGGWEYVSAYIKEHSDSNDRIYVWGWYPGIYVLAERVSATPVASEGSMHTYTPKELGTRVNQAIEAFEKHPPKFIVDSYKAHFPFDRPPLELWPSIQNGARLLQYLNRVPEEQSRFESVFLQTYGVQIDDFTRDRFLRADRPAAVERFSAAYEKLLAENPKWKDEAQRFEAMKPFRDYVMQHYKIVSLPQFEPHAVFQRK